MLSQMAGMNEPRLLAMAGALLRAPPTLLAAAGLLALGLAGGALPLLEVPGFELGLIASLASALLLGPALGIAAARRELSTPTSTATSTPSVLRPFAAAALALLALLALLFTAAATRAALATPCRPFGGAALFALAALPSALLAAALGTGCGLLAQGRRRRAALLYALVALGSLGATLAVGYYGPTATAHDHLLGFWPGPLYDEALEVDKRLLLFRAGTLAWSCAVLAGTSVVTARARATRVLAFGAAVACAVALNLLGGHTATRSELSSALGAVREGPRCVVHFAREKSDPEAERILRDCEYDAQAVARALGLPRPPRATVWLYRSPAEKRRLVGAGHTSFTKPWLAEIHVHEQGVPHPILRHELVHALASAVARGPLRVPARALVLVNPGLVEGLAVAVDVPAGSFDIHAWTRALRDQGRLPALDALLGATGFFGAAPARAYTAAGSFLRYLLDRYGAPAVLAAYREDDVARALGKPLAALEAEWHRFLDAVAVPPALAAQAEARFERGSVFARACARELASLEATAAAEAASGQSARAEALYRRASQLAGGDPAYLRAAAEGWRAKGDLDRAEALLGEALGRAEAAGGRASLRSALLVALGDLRLREADGAAAAARYAAALALGTEGAESRALRARLLAARDPSLRAAVQPWLLGEADGRAQLETSAAPLARYLAARARLLDGDAAGALEVLDALPPSSLPGPAFRLEARRMRAEALCRTRRWDAGVAAWGAAAAEAEPGAQREQFADAARRCTFERDASRAPP